jgi:hypothetical protein
MPERIADNAERGRLAVSPATEGSPCGAPTFRFAGAGSAEALHRVLQQGHRAFDIAQLVEAEQADAKTPEIGPSSHCKATPAAACKPSATNFCADCIAGSVV